MAIPGPSGRKAKAPMASWAARGIKRIDGQPLGEGEAGLLLPAGPQGPAFLVTHNFDVIYSYNAAESYTLAIAILAQRLAGGPGIVTPWPTDDPGLSRAGRREFRRCSPNTATTSAPPTARSAPRPSRRSPISRARTG